MYGVLIRCLAVIGLILLMSRLVGQTSPTSSDSVALEMGPVMITAQHQPQTARNSVHQVRILDETRIQQQAAQQLGDLLQVELGLYLYTDPALGQSVQLQGLSGEHVKILVDGVPVVGRLGGDLDLTQLPLQEVVRIELIEGPMSVEYGTNALAGVINLITRRETSEKLRVNLQAYEASVGPGHSLYEGFHNYRGSLRFRQGKHQFQLQAGRDFFGGSFAERELRRKQFSPKEQRFGTIGYGWSNKKWRLNWQSRGFDELLVRKDSARGAYRPKARDAYFTTTRFQHQLDSRYQFSDRWNWEGIWAYSTFLRTTETRLVDLLTLKDSTLASEGREEFLPHLMARGSFTFQAKERPFSWQVGYDLNRERLTGDKILDGAQEALDLAGFTSIEYRPHEKLTLRPGLRVAYHNRYDAPLTPSFHLRYSPSYQWTIKASYARGFRAPGLKELYLDFVDINHDIQGNVGLEAETADHLQAQVNWQRLKGKQLHQIEGQLFFNDVRQKIELANTGESAISFTYLNLDRIRNFGSRVEWKWRFGDWNSTIGASLLGTDQSQLEDVANALPITWAWQSHAQLSYTWSQPGIQANLFYRFTGPVQGYTNVGDEDQPEWYATQIPAFHWADASVQKSWADGQFRTSIGVKNLFDITTLAATGVPTAHSGAGGAAIGLGRQIFLQLQYTFSQS